MDQFNEKSNVSLAIKLSRILGADKMRCELWISEPILQSLPKFLDLRSSVDKAVTHPCRLADWLRKENLEEFEMESIEWPLVETI